MALPAEDWLLGVASVASALIWRWIMVHVLGDGEPWGFYSVGSGSKRNYAFPILSLLVT